MSSELPSSSATSSAADEALIASLLSPKAEVPHNPVTSASTETILAAADKKAEHQKADSFYSQGLPDLAPQVLSPVGGSPTNADSQSFTFEKKQ